MDVTNTQGAARKDRRTNQTGQGAAMIKELRLERERSGSPVLGERQRGPVGRASVSCDSRILQVLMFI